MLQCLRELMSRAPHLSSHVFKYRGRSDGVLSTALYRDVDAVEQRNMHANVIFDAKLGEGAYGVVWRAKEIDSGDVVAIKCMHTPTCAAGTVQLMRELRALRAFDHPHVLRLRGVYEDARGHVAIVTAVADCTLDSVISLLATSERRCLLICQMLQGIAYLHARGWIHCDIKPANILIFGETAVIGDLGMIRHVNDTDAYPPYVVTRWYRPPEVAFGHGELTPAVDIWSIACVWFQMLCNGEPIIKPSQRGLQACLCVMAGLPPAVRCYRTLCASAQRGVSAAWVARIYSLHNVHASIDDRDDILELQAIQKMLNFDDRKRPTARQLLREYFRRNTDEPSSLVDPMDATEPSDAVDALRFELTRSVYGPNSKNAEPNVCLARNRTI